MTSLSIVTLGHVHTEDLTALTPHFTKLEQLVLDVPPQSSLVEKRAELNRAIDAGTADWILVVREREVVDDALAREVLEVITAAKAWGFRVRTLPLYCGQPLELGDRAGELRLFHRRHLLRRGDLAVQGTVIRLVHPLRAMTFANVDEHRADLEKNAKRRNAIARALFFARDVIGTRRFDANTLRYIWIEAGFDRG